MNVAERRVIRNPILSGFYPDPSACRVGDDIYLVNSTFSWYPGIPVSHSRDLVSWQQIGNVIERADQLEFRGQRISRGLFAPAIRYWNGRFFVTCTDIDGIGNFVVTAENPAGPWSAPVVLGAPGIDPSLFFDDDGTAWYVGTRPAPEGPAYFGNWEVWAQEFDADALRLIGEPFGLWRGALRECVWPEGPHLYRKDGYYYLTIAEGGTGPDHAVSVARAESIRGPWAGKRSNPLITHRNLGKGAAVTNVGHGDLFDDPEGNWWMVLLASRPYGTERCANLGRETFLVPVVWEDGWPVVSPETGHVESEYPVRPSVRESKPGLPDSTERAELTAFSRALSEPPACRHFDASALPRDWLTLRSPAERVADLVSRPGSLRLHALPGTISGIEPVAFAGIRQRHFDWELSCSLEFDPAADASHSRAAGVSASAGIALVQSETNHILFELASLSSGRFLRVVRHAVSDASPADAEAGGDRPFSASDTSGSGVILAQASCPAVLCGSPDRAADSRVILSVVARGQRLAFRWRNPADPEDEWHTLAVGVDASILSTEKAGGFVGTVLGLFASGNGAETPAYADFDWMEYRQLY